MSAIVLKIEGLKISTFVASGPKTPVLLIHGNSSCGEIFRGQIEELRRIGHTVVAPDLPGHGRSDDAKNPRSTYSFPGYAKILQRLMESLGFLKYHVVGWSLGGHIGIELWYPNRNVLSLMITGTPPVSLSAEGAALAFHPTPIMHLAGTKVFGPDDVIAYGSAMLGVRPDRRLRIVRAIARTDGNARHWMVKNGLAGVGIDEVMAVGSCSRPLAIVQGKNDPFVNIPYCRELKYSNLWLNRPIIVDAGHAPHWQRPNLFNRYMRDFLILVD
jgi:pimeloyl-ACP methyl ester carboxylesterase